MKLTDTDQTCLTCWWSSLDTRLEVWCNHPDNHIVVNLETVKAELGSTKIGANCPGYQLSHFLQTNKGETP